MTTTSGTSTSDVTVAIHDLGGEGEPFLICHATGLCGRAYQPLANELHGRFHLWALDFRAQGDSGEPSDGDLRWSAMATDLLAAVDALGLGSFPAMGHSMGGAALLLAELERPGLVRSAYLYEPVIFPEDFVHSGGDNPLAGPARRRREVFASKAEALMRYAARPPLNVWRADAIAAYVEHGFEELEDGTVRLKCRAENEARIYEAVPRVTMEMVAGLALPTTVAVGGQDGEAGPAMFAPGVASVLGQARLHAFSQLGHFGPLQDPVTIGQDIMATVV